LQETVPLDVMFQPIDLSARDFQIGCNGVLSLLGNNWDFTVCFSFEMYVLGTCVCVADHKVTAVVLRWGSYGPRIVSDEKAAFGSSLKLLIYELLLSTANPCGFLRSILLRSPGNNSAPKAPASGSL
jgi:hypothetical protein